MAEKKKTEKTAPGATGAKSKSGGSSAPSLTGGAAKEKSQSELIDALAEKTGLTKAKTKEFLEAYAELLTEELLTAGSVQLPGIGKLKISERGERQGRNPSTGETITIKASKSVKLAAGKKFKDSFN